MGAIPEAMSSSTKGSSARDRFKSQYTVPNTLDTHWKHVFWSDASGMSAGPRTALALGRFWASSYNLCCCGWQPDIFQLHPPSLQSPSNESN